jgi:hypothetical protein
MSPKFFALVSLTAIAGLASASQAQNLLLNGSFESAGLPANGGSPSGATGWLGIGSNAGTRVTTDPTPQDGIADVLLTIPGGIGNSGVLQNSVNDGGLPSLVTPTQPLVFSFWIKGTFGDTGNLSYALRYLNNVGGIVASPAAGTLSAPGQISANSWTQYTFPLPAVNSPANALFVEFNAASGPLIAGNPTRVFLDNVSVTVVPEPATLGALASVSLLLTRRRR